MLLYYTVVINLANKEATLLPYDYCPSIFSERFTADQKEIRVYVDTDKKHPDPSGLLIWGWDADGEFVPGDFNKRFTRAGKPLKVPYSTKGCMGHSEEQSRKTEAIKAYIKALPK